MFEASEHCNGKLLRLKVGEALKTACTEETITQLLRLPSKRLINSLLFFISSPEENVRKNAVTAIGAAVSDLANRDMEAARIVVRRLFWSLNEESGSIGWGAPEAIAEILVRHQGLADEFSAILVSFLTSDENHPRPPALQRSIQSALARIAWGRPELLRRDRDLTCGV